MKKGNYINKTIQYYSKLINVLIPILILVLINIICHDYFFRIDLTTEKKYSISVNTKKLTKEIDDIIYFKVFLHGDLPPQYKKLANELKYMLYELKAQSDYIEFDFIVRRKVPNL